MRQSGSSGVRGVLMALGLLAACLPCSTPILGQERPKASAWLGVYLGRVEDRIEHVRLELEDDEVARQEPERGVSVLAVVKDSPAARAGLRARDRILAVNGTPVNDTRELLAILAQFRPGGWVTLTLERRGRTLERTARLKEFPGDSAEMKMRRAWLGADAIELPESLREHFGAPREAGVLISAVEPGSPAELAGLQVGDVLYAFDGIGVPSVQALEWLAAFGGVRNTVELSVIRGGAPIVLEAVLEEAPEADNGAGVPARRMRVRRYVLPGGSTPHGED